MSSSTACVVQVFEHELVITNLEDRTTKPLHYSLALVHNVDINVLVDGRMFLEILSHEMSAVLSSLPCLSCPYSFRYRLCLDLDSAASDIRLIKRRLLDTASAFRDAKATTTVAPSGMAQYTQDPLFSNISKSSHPRNLLFPLRLIPSSSSLSMEARRSSWKEG